MHEMPNPASVLQKQLLRNARPGNGDTNTKGLILRNSYPRGRGPPHDDPPRLAGVQQFLALQALAKNLFRNDRVNIRHLRLSCATSPLTAHTLGRGSIRLLSPSSFCPLLTSSWEPTPRSHEKAEVPLSSFRPHLLPPTKRSHVRVHYVI